MPIEFSCPHCQCLLRVADDNAGKRARCPQCNAINRIPGQSDHSATTGPARPQPAHEPTMPQVPVPPSSQPGAATTQYHIDSVSGQTYGPVSQAELNEWVKQGRVTANCSIRTVGQQAGMPASAYFPALGGQAATPQQANPFVNAPAKSDNPFASTAQQKFAGAGANPYGAPASAGPARSRGRGLQTGPIAPVQADLGRIFEVAFDVFKQNLGLLLGASCTMALFSGADYIVSLIQEEAGDPGLELMLSCVSFVLSVIGLYLMIGLTQMCLKLVRGESANYGDLFGGGLKIFSIIGFWLLLFIVPLLIIFMAGITGIFPLIFMGMGIAFIILLSFIVIWPAYSLIVDDKSSVMSSFGLATEIGSKNVLNSIVLALATFGISLAGCAAILVGLLFTNAFIAVLWATAYLMMSGQVR